MTTFAVSAVVGFSAHAQNFLIYSNDFELGAGPEWSNTQSELTPLGYRQYLGRFGNGVTNVLTLSNLPPHTNLTVLLDLFVIRSWDGNGDQCCGPDIWDVRLVDSSTPLFRTSFSDNRNRQAYPATRPNGDNVSRSGASEVGTLGYTFDYGAGQAPSDAVYPMSLSFPHSSDSLTLQFSASLAGNADESWGLDNIKVLAG